MRARVGWGITDLERGTHPCKDEQRPDHVRQRCEARPWILAGTALYLNQKKQRRGGEGVDRWGPWGPPINDAKRGNERGRGWLLVRALLAQGDGFCTGRLLVSAGAGKLGRRGRCKLGWPCWLSWFPFPICFSLSFSYFYLYSSRL